MIKRLLIGSAALVALGGLVFGTDLHSYVFTSARKVRSGVKASIPLDFEIQRARELVEHLVPDIQQNMHLIAQEEVEVEDLTQQLAEAEKNLTQERDGILALRSDLENSQGRFRFGSRKATGNEVKTELTRRFERYKTIEATLEAKRKMRDAREKSLVAARHKLEGMLGAKRDLEVQVQNLEARLKMVQAAETTSEFQFDDSRLARCKKLVQELRKRLDVAERIVEQNGKLTETSWIDTEAAEDIGEQVDHYFGPKSTPRAASL